MANWSNLKASVAEVIKTNGNQEITGQILQNVLNSIISNIGANASFAGIATPETNPGTPDGPIFYLASESGTYSNFGGIIVSDNEVVILNYTTSWKKLQTGLVKKSKMLEIESYLKPITAVIPVTTGVDLLYQLDVIIPKNTDFIVRLDDPNSAISGSLATIRYSNNNADNLHTNKDNSFNKNFDITYIIIQRGATGIVNSGDLTLSVNLSQVYNKEEVDGKIENVNTIATNANSLATNANSLATNANSLATETSDLVKNLIGGESETELEKNYQSGGYYNTDGSFISGSGNYTTSNIQLDGYDKLKVSKQDAGQNSTRAFVLYNSSGLVVSSFFERDIYNNGGEYEISLENNISYMKASWSSGECTIIGVKTIEGSFTKSNNNVMYVDISGNDNTGDGSSSNPFKTIQKAIDNCAEGSVININKGTYYGQFIDLSSLTAKHISIYGNESIIINGTNLTDGKTPAKVSGYTNIYSINYALSDVSKLYNIFQHNIDDVNTIINDKNRHFLCGDKNYRCDSTVIMAIDEYYRTGRTSISEFSKEEALAKMDEEYANNNYYYYYDSAENLLYFTSPSTEYSTYPLYYPSTQKFISDNENNASINIDDLSVYYSGMSLNNFTDCKINNISVKYCSGNCISYDNAINLELEHVEVCRSKENELGDGFNGHGESSGITKVSLKYCWAHDCFDDGQSEHGKCMIKCEYNIYEHCGKSGFTPIMNSSNYLLLNCIFLNNSSVTTGNGIDTSQSNFIDSYIEIVGCEAKGNKNVGFLISGQSKLKDCYSDDSETGFEIRGESELINCLASNQSLYGYNVLSSGRLIAKNCKTYNNTKDVFGSGNIEIQTYNDIVKNY